MNTCDDESRSIILLNDAGAAVFEGFVQFAEVSDGVVYGLVGPASDFVLCIDDVDGGSVSILDSKHLMDGLE